MSIKYVNLITTPDCSRAYEGSTRSPFKLGAKVKLVRELGNIYDTEAVAIHMENLDKVGFVANSTNTVIYGCSSAGNLCKEVEAAGGLEGTILFLVSGLPIIEVKMGVPED